MTTNNAVATTSTPWNGSSNSNKRRHVATTSTHWNYFNESQRQATKDAGSILGWQDEKQEEQVSSLFIAIVCATAFTVVRLLHPLLRLINPSRFPTFIISRHHADSCPTSPSLLPMISRWSAHPGHPEDVMSCPTPSYSLLTRYRDNLKRIFRYTPWW